MDEKKHTSKKAVGSKSTKSGAAASPARAKKGAAAESTTGARARTAGARESVPAPAKKKAATKKGGAGPSVPPPPSAKPDASTLRREAAKKVAIAIASAALDKKAERVEIVDIGEKVDYSDYLVVMTGRSDRQVVAIAQGIEEALKQRGQRIVGREGLPEGHWVLLDFADVIVHIFLDEARKYYDLEGLWLDAPRVPTPQFTSTGAGAGPGGANSVAPGEG